MSYNADDWRRAITNLIKMTTRKELSWHSTDIFKADAWTEVDRSFSTKFKDKIYVVSRTRSRHYIDEDEFYWVDGVDFSVFRSVLGREEWLASAPSNLNIVGQLCSIAEASFAFDSDALGGLLD